MLVRRLAYGSQSEKDKKKAKKKHITGIYTGINETRMDSLKFSDRINLNMGERRSRCHQVESGAFTFKLAE